MAAVYAYQNKTLDTTVVTVREDQQQKALMVLVDGQGATVTPIAGVTLSPLPANEVRH